MIKHNENGKDEWKMPKGKVDVRLIKEQRAERREKFKFLQEEEKEEDKE